MKPILYHNPNSCSLASHLALELSGVPYEAKFVDFSKNEQRAPEFLALNPKGRVPALVTEHGVLTETPAILVYICQLRPESNLTPLHDPFAFAQLQSFNSYLCSTVHVAHAHNYRGYRWADSEEAIEAMKKKVPQNMRECFGLIERDYMKGPWVLGEQLTVCDLYLYTIGRWLPGDGVDINEFPRVAAHAARVEALDAVQRVLSNR